MSECLIKIKYEIIFDHFSLSLNSTWVLIEIFKIYKKEKYYSQFKERM